MAWTPTETSLTRARLGSFGHGRQPTYKLVSVVYQANANANGCQWQSVVGNLKSLPGYGAKGFKLHLFAPGAYDYNAIAGSRSAWGALASSSCWACSPPRP